MYDEQGEKTWDCTLDVYGKVANFEGRSLSDCPFRFQGQYEDEETGLYYNRFRYYDSFTGNYISQDPIGLGSGVLGLYNYVNNVNLYCDILGLEWRKGEPKPKNWRLPKNGSWDGLPGHSNFIPYNPESLGLPQNTKIPFVEGVPDFSCIEVREAIEVEGLTGIQAKDRALTADALVKKYPNEFKTQKEALDWMTNNNVTPHHYHGKMQLVPTDAHGGIRHTGTASDMRKGNHH